MRKIIIFLCLLSLSIIAISQVNTHSTDKYRIQKHEAYPTLESTSKQLKISSYNAFENPTGIYFFAGSEVSLSVGATQGEPIALRVHNFETNSDNSYPLTEGHNKIKIKESGLGYISFYTDNYEKISSVEIDIKGGKINGYFDKNKHSRDDWKSILDNTVCNFIDIKGDLINLCYTVDDLQKHCADGMALIDAYDEIVAMQFDLMGLTKYNKHPKNHMFSRTTKGGLFADGYGAGLAKDAMHELANPDIIAQNTWTIAHELGHVNQIRPGLKWVSTTEVSNNVYSSFVEYNFSRNKLRLEHERINDGDGNNVIGGRLNAYLNYGIVKGEQWLCQKGPDKMKDYQNGGDHFVKLSPLWQLMLYYRLAEGTSWSRPDWYADVAEIVRNTDETGMSNGQLQLNFMRNVCDVTKENLTDFFEKAGMLKPIDKDMDDYTRGQLTITQKDCDELKKYAAKYKKPKSPTIYYITGNSIDAYAKQLPVQGKYGQGITWSKEQSSCVIDHTTWKNVTVFETYIGNKLEKVAMVGTDSPNNSTTLVRYPESSTRIEAVSWNGKRTLVFGKR